MRWPIVRVNTSISNFNKVCDVFVIITIKSLCLQHGYLIDCRCYDSKFLEWNNKMKSYIKV